MKKEIPNSIEAEQSVLGAMMLSKYALQKSIESLSDESFFLDKHGKIFNALKEIASKEIPVDITTLTNELLPSAVSPREAQRLSQQFISLKIHRMANSQKHKVFRNILFQHKLI